MTQQSNHCYYCGWRLHYVNGFWRSPDRSVVCASHSAVAKDAKLHVSEKEMKR